jgi:hypothetical protein
VPAHRYLEDPGIHLDAAGMLAGWVFGVPKIFLGALDIRAKRSGFGDAAAGSDRWLRRRPPVLSFKAGDVFYDPPEVRVLRWRLALRRLKRCAQVKDAIPDRLNPHDGTLVPGTLSFSVTDYLNGKPGKSVRVHAGQSEFEVFLRTGAVP